MKQNLENVHKGEPYGCVIKPELTNLILVSYDGKNIYNWNTINWCKEKDKQFD